MVVSEPVRGIVAKLNGEAIAMLHEVVTVEDFERDFWRWENSAYRFTSAKAAIVAGYAQWNEMEIEGYPRHRWTPIVQYIGSGGTLYSLVQDTVPPDGDGLDELWGLKPWPTELEWTWVTGADLAGLPPIMGSSTKEEAIELLHAKFPDVEILG